MSNLPEIQSADVVLIDSEAFKKKLGLRSDSRFYELAKQDPKFPKPIRRGRRWSRYVLAEANAYILALIRDRDEKAAA